MTEFVAHHPRTKDLALFKSDNKYWIGSYCQFLQHQNDEPMYVWIRGNYATESEGID